MLTLMSFRRGRYIMPEILDDQVPERAAPSLSDIVRINRYTGGHRVLRQAMAASVRPEDRFTMLDVGAASGDAAAIVRREYPNARVVSLDYRMHHVWTAPGDQIVADGFALPLRPRSFDIVYCGLFLHHFSNDQIAVLLRSFGTIAKRLVIANDLERHVLAYYFLPATRWLFRWDPLTLHDGPISVQAGFTRNELEELARKAGLQQVRVRRSRPAFRLCLLGKPI